MKVTFLQKNAGAAQAGESALRRRVSFLQKKRISEPSEGAERIRYVDFGR